MEPDELNPSDTPQDQLNSMMSRLARELMPLNGSAVELAQLNAQNAAANSALQGAVDVRQLDPGYIRSIANSVDVTDPNGNVIGRFASRAPDGRFARANRNDDQLSEDAVAQLYRDLDPSVLDRTESEPRSRTRLPSGIGPRISIPARTEHDRPYDSLRDMVMRDVISRPARPAEPEIDL